MLPYVAWIAIWQAMYDPRLWIQRVHLRQTPERMSGSKLHSDV